MSTKKGESSSSPRLSRKLRQQIEDYAEAVRDDIKDCGCDQPAPEGEIIWVRSQHTDLSALMDTHGVPDELIDLVASRIQCPLCGQQLARYSDVGVEWWMDALHKRRIEEASEIYHDAL